MFITMRQATLAFIAGGATLVLSSQPVQAGPFLDWLFGRPVLVYPAPDVNVYPNAEMAAPAYGGAAYVVPTNAVPANNAPVSISPPIAPAPIAQVTNYAPGYAAPQYTATPMAVPQPVVVGYAPTFRTSWQQVPVTYYRPVVTNNLSGYPTVTAQPCNTYAYQAQRVPTLVRRPWFPFSAPAYVAPVYAAPAFAAPVYTPPVAAGYSTAAPATLNYAPAASVMPACSGCPTAVSGSVSTPLSTVPNSGSAIPSYSAPAYSSPAAGNVLGPAGEAPAAGYSAAPADQAPSLLQNNYPSAPLIGAPQVPSEPIQGNTTIPPSTTAADAASTRTNGASPYRVAPIPAPDLQKFGPKREAPQAPPLLNGRERTVSNSSGQSVTVGQASWVMSVPQPDSSAAVGKPSAPKRLWNDSGWQSSKGR